MKASDIDDANYWDGLIESVDKRPDGSWWVTANYSHLWVPPGSPVEPKVGATLRCWCDDFSVRGIAIGDVVLFYTPSEPPTS